MTLEIHKTERFQIEYQKYAEAIKKMPDDIHQKNIMGKLNQLLHATKKLDSMHAEMIYSGQLMSVGTDFKTEISDLRKELNSALKQYLN
jgi:hypothetical protein